MGGVLTIGAETEQFRLLRDGIVFHELNYDELRSTCVGLARVLLQPGLNTMIDLDHRVLWSWCADVILLHRPALLAPGEREIGDLFRLCIRAAIANARRPPASQKEWDDSVAESNKIPYHMRELANEAYAILAYLSFPLLEAVVKRACSSVVDPAGHVLRDFTVTSRSGRPRDYQAGKICSSLRDLLYLHHDQFASPTLKVSLDECIANLRRLDSTREPYDLIFEWRNSALHGSASLPTVGGTLVTLAILILLDGREANYEEVRSETLKRIQFDLRTSGGPPRKSPWGFYLPI